MRRGAGGETERPGRPPTSHRPRPLSPSPPHLYQALSFPSPLARDQAAVVVPAGPSRAALVSRTARTLHATERARKSTQTNQIAQRRRSSEQGKPPASPKGRPRRSANARRAPRSRAPRPPPPSSHPRSESRSSTSPAASSRSPMVPIGRDERGENATERRSREAASAGRPRPARPTRGERVRVAAGGPVGTRGARADPRSRPAGGRSHASAPCPGPFPPPQPHRPLSLFARPPSAARATGKDPVDGRGFAARAPRARSLHALVDFFSTCSCPNRLAP